MPDHLPHHRLRRRADDIDDPDVSSLLRRLADLQELDWRRQGLPIESAERDALDREIAERSHRILDWGLDDDDGERDP